MYKKEEIIYNKIFDVSKETGIPNNKGYIRVVKRTKVKPKNFFRRKEKIIIYFDIEYNTPDLLGEYNEIYRIVNEMIWEAENYVLNYKLDNCYTDSITRLFKW